LPTTFIPIIVVEYNEAQASKTTLARRRRWAIRRVKMKVLTSLLAIVLIAGLLVGCAGMSTQQQRVLSGGAIGAGAGAALGAVTGGSVVGGAAIGAAGGAVGGYIYDRSKRR
jgi:osmotically inducible lipoprotein OsmB